LTKNTTLHTCVSKKNAGREYPSRLAMIINLSADGAVNGIELLNANKQPTENHGKLILKMSGCHREIALAA